MMNRKDSIEQLKNTPFDLLIIGGGITGAGIALDAVSRGLRVGLIEMADFAAGTSSRSTKLIHGGLRYLKQFEFKLVNEVGRERAIVHRLAPHLVHPDKMLLPLIKDGNYGYWLTSMGLTVYDFLAGVEGDDRRKMLSREETISAEPLLRNNDLEGAGLYAEYRTDDARLVISVLKTAAEKGATVANYVKAKQLTIREERINGLLATDMETGDEFSIEAKHIVNATGPWVDDVRDFDVRTSRKHLRLTKGVHLVVSRERLPVKQTVYFDNADKRMIFAVPRGTTTYIGTTDTEYTGDKQSPDVLAEDVNYILDAVNQMFPSVQLVPEDVESSWAGLRPLIHEEGKSASEVSRKDEIFVSRNGLISIAGGKLTGYRKMAERVVNRVLEASGRKAECTTDTIVLSGGQFKSYDAVRNFSKELKETHNGLFTGRSDAGYLVHNYGNDAAHIAKEATAIGKSTEALIEAEIAYTVKHEMVQRALDFVERRTGRLNFDIHSVRDNAPFIVAALGERLGWDDVRRAAELKEVEQATARVSGKGIWRT